MPGANCSFTQCTASRYHKHPGVHLFAITARKNEAYTKWRNDTIEVIRKYRKDLDAEFVAKAKEGKKWICDRHYLPTDIETSGMP